MAKYLKLGLMKTLFFSNLDRILQPTRQDERERINGLRSKNNGTCGKPNQRQTTNVLWNFSCWQNDVHGWVVRTEPSSKYFVRG
jgi:hypothetical protein